MIRDPGLSLAACGVLVAAILLSAPTPSRAQTVTSPAPVYQYVQPNPTYATGSPYRGNVVGPSYVGPWYTYAARPLRPRRLFRRGDPTQEYWWPTGRGVPLAKPWLGP